MPFIGTNVSSIVALLVVLSGSLLQAGCVSVDVKLASFMSPDRTPRTAHLPAGYAVQDLVIHHGNQLIGITHAHHPDSTSVVIYCGGDRFHRSINGGAALEALAQGADVILFDYPGYGDTTGQPTTAHLLETALAAYDYADGLQTSAGKKRVVYGFSLGGVLASQVASRRPADGLVLEATAANAESWARSQIPLWMKPIVRPRVEPGLARIDAVRALTSFRGQVLVLTSDTDRQAPAALSRRLARDLHRHGVKVQLVSFSRARHGEIAHTRAFAPMFRNFLDRLQESQWSLVQR